MEDGRRRYSPLSGSLILPNGQSVKTQYAKPNPVLDRFIRSIDFVEWKCLYISVDESTPAIHCRSRRRGLQANPQTASPKRKKRVAANDQHDAELEAAVETRAKHLQSIHATQPVLRALLLNVFKGKTEATMSDGSTWQLCGKITMKRGNKKARIMQSMRVPRSTGFDDLAGTALVDAFAEPHPVTDKYIRLSTRTNSKGCRRTRYTIDIKVHRAPLLLLWLRLVRAHHDIVGFHRSTQQSRRTVTSWKRAQSRLSLR